MQNTETERAAPSLRGRAWRLLLEVHRDLVDHMSRDLQDNFDLDLLYYDVLLHVSEGGDGRRMSELAEAVVLSKSGLTSVIDRMEGEGLVERRPDPQDRRAIRIVLTCLGRDRFEVAAAHHKLTVRSIFTSLITDQEASVFLDVLTRVRQGLLKAPEAE